VANPRFREIEDVATDGQSLLARINGDRGWLLYCPAPGDPGFSSRNPEFAGAPEATIEYVLGNGQRDKCPASWALPVEEMRRALAYFRERRKPRRAPGATFVERISHGNH